MSMEPESVGINGAAQPRQAAASATSVPPALTNALMVSMLLPEVDVRGTWSQVPDGDVIQATSVLAKLTDAISA